MQTDDAVLKNVLSPVPFVLRDNWLILDAYAIDFNCLEPLVFRQYPPVLDALLQRVMLRPVTFICQLRIICHIIPYVVQ